jgi:hypothetical protein
MNVFITASDAARPRRGKGRRAEGPEVPTETGKPAGFPALEEE